MLQKRAALRDVTNNVNQHGSQGAPGAAKARKASAPQRREGFVVHVDTSIAAPPSCAQHGPVPVPYVYDVAPPIEPHAQAPSAVGGSPAAKDAPVKAEGRAVLDDTHAALVNCIDQLNTLCPSPQLPNGGEPISAAVLRLEQELSQLSRELGRSPARVSPGPTLARRDVPEKQASPIAKLASSLRRSLAFGASPKRTETPAAGAELARASAAPCAALTPRVLSATPVGSSAPASLDSSAPPPPSRPGQAAGVAGASGAPAPPGLVEALKARLATRDREVAVLSAHVQQIAAAAQQCLAVKDAALADAQARMDALRAVPPPEHGPRTEQLLQLLHAAQATARERERELHQARTSAHRTVTMMDARFKTDLAAARADAAGAWEQVKALTAAGERRGARGAPAEGAPALGLPGLGAAGAPELPRAGAASEPGGVLGGAPPACGPAAAERVEGTTQCDLTGEGMDNVETLLKFFHAEAARSRACDAELRAALEERDCEIARLRNEIAAAEW